MRIPRVQLFPFLLAIIFLVPCASFGGNTSPEVPVVAGGLGPCRAAFFLRLTFFRYRASCLLKLEMNLKGDLKIHETLNDSFARLIRRNDSDLSITCDGGPSRSAAYLPHH